MYPPERVVKRDHSDELPNTIPGVSRVVEHCHVCRLGIDSDGRTAHIEMGNWVELVVREKAKPHRDAMVLLLAKGCLASMVNPRDNGKEHYYSDCSVPLLGL